MMSETLSTPEFARLLDSPAAAGRRFPIRVRHALALLGLLYLVGIYWGMPSEFDSAIDSIAPYAPLQFAAAYRDSGVAVAYPALHHVILLAVDAVILAGVKLAGGWTAIRGTWPYGFRDPVAVLTALIVAARAVSLLMALGTVELLRRWCRLAGAGRATSVAVALFALSEVTTFYARSANVDIPYTFWLTLAWLALWRYLFRGRGRSDLILCGVASGLAVATKDQAGGVVVGLILSTLIIRPSGAAALPRLRLRAAATLVAVSGLVYVGAAILPQPARWAAHIAHLRRLAPHNRPTLIRTVVGQPLTPGAKRKEPTLQWLFDGHVKLARNTGVQLTQFLTPAGLVLAGIGAVSLARRRPEALVLLLVPPLVYYLMFLGPVWKVFPRYLFPMALPATVLAAVGVNALGRRWPEGRPALARRWALGAVVAYQFVTGYLPVTYVQATDLKGQLATSLEGLVPPGTPLLWSGGASRQPNARVYTRYPMVLGPDADEPNTSRVHVFHEPETPPGFRLSQYSKPPVSPDRPPLAVWRYPEFVKPWIHVPCLFEYRLEAWPGIATAAEGINP